MGGGASRSQWGPPECIEFHKDGKSNVGLRLSGSTAHGSMIAHIAAGSVASQCSSLLVGDRLLSVNGAQAGGPVRAAKLLDRADGTVTCMIAKPADYLRAVAQSKEEAVVRAKEDDMLRTALVESASAAPTAGGAAGASSGPCEERTRPCSAGAVYLVLMGAARHREQSARGFPTHRGQGHPERRDARGEHVRYILYTRAVSVNRGKRVKLNCVLA
eukprot:7381886-Prymnesium_polylepis.1